METTRGRLTALALAAALAVGLVPAAQGSAEASTDVGVDIVNELRALSGLAPVRSDGAMRADSRKHSQYMVRVGTIAHHQDPSSPHYTPEGDRAARESNLKVSSSPTLSVRAAVHGLMAAPFHGIGLIDPRLESSGGAMYADPDAARWRSGYTLNIIRGRASSVPAGTTYPIVWPGDGSTVAIDRYPGSETPDPLSGCSGWSAPTGLPLLVQFASDEPITSASVRGPDGASIPVCFFDRHTYRNSDEGLQRIGRSALAARNAAVVIPRTPLVPGRHAAEVRTATRTLAWSFSVGTTNVAPRDTSIQVTAPTRDPEVRGIDHACPSSAPSFAYADVDAASTHARAISCATWWGVARGSGDDRYRPTSTVTRAQMASFVARLVVESGGTLPQSPSSRFADILGSPHAHPIRQLADVGVVTGDATGRFRPDDPVTRAQMAAFLVRAYEYRTGRTLRAESGWFHDTGGSSHAGSIDKAATAGLTGGTRPGTFAPGAPVRRDAMGSFAARLLDLLVEQRWASHPE